MNEDYRQPQALPSVPNETTSTETEKLSPGSDGLGTARHPAPFALLVTETLRVCRFQHEEELQDAIRALRMRDRGYVALIYHEGAGTYIVPETWE